MAQTLLVSGRHGSSQPRGAEEVRRDRFEFRLDPHFVRDELAYAARVRARKRRAPSKVSLLLFLSFAFVSFFCFRFFRLVSFLSVFLSLSF